MDKNVLEFRRTVQGNILKAFGGDELQKAVYVDNAQNRKLGRVGKEYGGRKKEDDAQTATKSKKEILGSTPDGKKQIGNIINNLLDNKSRDFDILVSRGGNTMKFLWAYKGTKDKPAHLKLEIGSTNSKLRKKTYKELTQSLYRVYGLKITDEPKNFLNGKDDKVDISIDKLSFDPQFESKNKTNKPIRKEVLKNFWDFFTSESPKNGGTGLAGLLSTPWRKFDEKLTNGDVPIPTTDELYVLRKKVKESPVETFGKDLPHAQFGSSTKRSILEYINKFIERPNQYSPKKK